MPAQRVTATIGIGAAQRDVSCVLCQLCEGPGAQQILDRCHRRQPMEYRCRYTCAVACWIWVHNPAHQAQAMLSLIEHLCCACWSASASLRATMCSPLRPSGDAAAAASSGNTYLRMRGSALLMSAAHGKRTAAQHAIGDNVRACAPTCSQLAGHHKRPQTGRLSSRREVVCSA